MVNRNYGYLDSGHGSQYAGEKIMNNLQPSLFIQEHNFPSQGIRWEGMTDHPVNELHIRFLSLKKSRTIESQCQYTYNDLNAYNSTRSTVARQFNQDVRHQNFSVMPVLQ